MSIILRIKLTLLMSALIAAFAAKVQAAGGASSHQEKEIIPPTSDFSFNERWVNPKLAGRHFWYCLNTLRPFSQVYDADRNAWKATASQVKLAATALIEKWDDMHLDKDPMLNYKFRLFRDGKIPMTSFQRDEISGWDEQ